jgi:hypothetical protein
MRLRRRIKPIDRLIDNMNLLEDMVINPERFGAFILLRKIKINKSKVPTNINLLEFKIKMEFEIRRISRKIERKLGFELPDGLK